MANGPSDNDQNPKEGDLAPIEDLPSLLSDPMPANQDFHFPTTDSAQAVPELSTPDDPFAVTPSESTPALDMNGDLAPLDFSAPPPADSAQENFMTGMESPASIPLQELPPPEIGGEPIAATATESATPESNAQTAQPATPLTVKAPEPETTQAIDAEFPWTIKITGHLRATERERLLEMISDHDMRIREMDLEPQLDAGKILIPRISEYAAVLIVGALRSTAAKIEVFPSDQEELFARTSQPAEIQVSNPVPSQHPAEKIPVTSDHNIPSLGANFEVIDTLSASLALATQIVHAKESAIYQKAIDDLKKELQYKAFYKGAQALVNLQIQLIPLSPMTHYRAVVMATAISAKSPTP